MKKSTILLILILTLFLGTRLYKIDEIPSSVYWDEASIGYNAYSISQTGKDEWGQFLPVHFKAFGEYKLPVYIYTTALSVSAFGLNELAVRLPAVVFAFFNILLTYFIAKKISSSKAVGLLSAFFLSISPYFFIFSRTGYEATAGLTLFLLGVLAFLNASQRPWFFLFSGLAFVLSMYTYNAYRILSPLVLLIFTTRLLTIHRIHLTKSLVVVFITGLIFILGCLPLVNFLKSESSISRFQAIGIENLDRKKVFIVLDIVQNYLSHFNPIYLFINGDKNLRSQQSGFGQLFVYDAILLFLGLLYLRSKELVHLKGNSKVSRWPLILLLLSFLPASVAREAPHALRSLSAAPFFSIITSFGVIYLQNKFSVNKEKLVLGVVVVYLGLFLVYFNNFLNVYSLNSSSYWQEGYKLVYQHYAKEFKSYDHVLISDRYAQPYIFALFYQQYDPQQFWSSLTYNTDIRAATSQVKGFDKFIFDDVDYNQLPLGKTLIFTHPTDRLDELGVKNILYHKDGSVAFYIYEYSK
ncbi:MAG: hypothetical protein UU73_C0001G0188 [Candidatus Daviesbacteria bacterium GW2011_GWA1_41_61]|uniref:Glycosyltransferase RgtA/B/C/D-like domain-containing protein n=1 Tax=Candidatus Daviesbacteria bacterium GW2011_GWA2_40_9 TaxID=1618424 RepID=A0A0G0WE44_9BACT|nr:MAG: glycosyl transferase family 39 [Candidatus Daviesbacteria bacterium GW2011_GWC1_40_9]KKR82555.1 MAG: hypothetical protein UU29_C0011G0002 [Candidatus Daviesbacteria bacterium GW2011_GWA2_40_9]KKR93007.1 MAG: hypothetical protein UU44_C0004G0189 [Candidatus Daviesbacteria bacterium GW2011_GWB1_41_15]KKS15551.1 MAG: hypothetical protein UU73_C0001G0188 [Candidatus Daviesbacteria bacterium GW2011_GWA1_41_61]